MGTIKDRNSKDLTKVEEIKKRWQEYTEMYRKGLNDLDNHDGMITHLEPDSLEYVADQLASIRQMSRQVSHGLAGDYQEDEQADVRGSAGDFKADEPAGVAWLSCRV